MNDNYAAASEWADLAVQQPTMTHYAQVAQARATLALADQLAELTALLRKRLPERHATTVQYHVGPEALSMIRPNVHGPRAGDVGSSQEIPREITRVRGCTCNGGGNVHAGGCPILTMPWEQAKAAIDEAEQRINAYVADLNRPAGDTQAEVDARVATYVELIQSAKGLAAMETPHEHNALCLANPMCQCGCDDGVPGTRCNTCGISSKEQR